MNYKERPIFKSTTLDELFSESEEVRQYIEKRKNNDDPYQLIYHYSRPCMEELNDPNGLCFYNEKWHLFYQKKDDRFYWGHLVSDDLINWVELPFAHYPNPPEEGCWSGGVCINGDTAFSLHYGWNETWDYGLVFAKANDPLLLNWTRLNEDGPSIKSDSRLNEGFYYKVYDPFVWYEDGVFYALSGRNEILENEKYVRQIYLFKSTDGVDWQYMHPFIENDYAGELQDDAGCPYFFKIKDDKYLLVHFCHHLFTSKYAVGTLDKKTMKFTITSGGRFSEPFCRHAPSVWPMGENEFYTIFNIRNNEVPYMSLPRIISERNYEVYEKPIEALKSLRGDNIHKQELLLKNQQEYVLDDVHSREFELELCFDMPKCASLEMRIFKAKNNEEYTSVYFMPKGGTNLVKKEVGWDGAASLIMGDTSHSSLEQPAIKPSDRSEVEISEGEKVNIRIFADRLVAEVFVNDKKSIIINTKPDLKSDMISFIPHGANVEIDTVDFWRMKSIF